MLMTLFAASLVYPTVLWTVALGFVILYWLLVAGGALDVDGMHGATDASAHAADAVFHAAHAAADGAHAAATAVGGDTHHVHISDAAGLLGKLGLRQVPLTVLGTALVLLNFWGCYFAIKVTGALPLLRGSLLMVVVFVLSLPIAGLLCRPLRPLFKVHEAPTRAQVIGKMGVISTGKVDARFGQAKVDDGGAGLIVEVRAATGNGLARGDRVVLVSWNAELHAYEVERLDAGLATNNPA
ncbi:MAG: hypothetical protein SF187_04975 [Deltaproteobacteria bacterium]|nr:hypothetical protein [Deltaproteobacteria bacterium]